MIPVGTALILSPGQHENVFRAAASRPPGDMKVSAERPPLYHCCLIQHQYRTAASGIGPRSGCERCHRSADAEVRDAADLIVPGHVRMVCALIHRA
jgi:hypothetical protein